MEPKLSIVFVNYNSTRLLGQALASLEGARTEVSLETIVVDNTSKQPDRVRAVCQKFGARLLLLDHNIGYGAAANRGARLAQGDCLAVANPDLVFAKGAVETLVRFLDRNPDAGVVGPQLVYPDGAFQPSARRFPGLRYVLAGRRSPLVRLFPGYGLSREFLYADIHRENRPVAVEAIIGTFMVFRRKAFEEMGGFDERFFMYAEDMDICRRLQRNGWRVYLEPRARVRHYYGAVRKKHQRFSEYQRLRALCMFFSLNRNSMFSAMITFAFAGYLFVLEAGALIGLSEYEYSWRRRRDGS